MLPTSVQSRIPDLQSLRRSKNFSILSSRLRSSQRQNDDVGQIVVEEAEAEDSAVELKACAPIPSSDAGSPLEISRPKYPGSGNSGVKWRYAEQGTFLQHSASRETEDLAFARKSYIDSVAYMLKGLPDDMDNYETSVIRRALPKSCAQVDANGQIGAGPGRPRWLPSDRAKTFLRSAVQGSVAIIVLFSYFLLSFLAVIIRAGADFERQYNVSQHIVSGGLTFATAVGKRSGALGERICAISDGKVGKAVSELAVWTLEGVTGGIHDGIGQGLLLIEQRQK
ncbi:peroxisomal targeting signal 2 receptor [Hypoxylon texense]